MSIARLGLKGRALAFCVLLLSTTVGTLSCVLIWQQHRATIQEIRDKALVHSHSLSRTAEADVLLNDTRSLQRVVQAGASADEFAMAQIVSADGKLLARFERSRSFVPELETEPAAVAGQGRAAGGEWLEWTANQLGVIVPIWRQADDIDLGLVKSDDESAKSNAPVGYVLLVYSLGELHSRLARNILVSVLLSAVVIAAGIAVTFVMVRQMLRPLEELAQTSSAIAQGDLSKRAPEGAVAEVGELARSFNHMAETIRQYTEGLEAQVMERTAALAEALRRAEAATIAKSEFLANMSHEIRTPMTAIMGYTDILIEQSWGREAQEPLSVVKRNGQHLLQIINDILDLSKIESGKLEVERIRVPLMPLIAEIKSLMRVRSEAKGLSLLVEYEGEMPESIDTDPTRVRQILINLTGNAIKFTEAGSVRIVVRFERYATRELAEALAAQVESPTIAAGVPRILAGDAYLRIDVVDTGIGIASEMQERLFQPFSQADNSMSRKYGGTGLGLAISRRLAQRMGGTVFVESKLGQGSTFSLIIATGSIDGVRIIANPSDEVVADAHETPVPGNPGRLSCRILLAEDGPDNQRLISFVLKKAGAEVEIAENGKIAVEMVRAAEEAGTPFDVVLMDMQMPVLDGYGATGQLRRMKYARPIIALTAHAMSGDREKCISVGCTDYATKPIDRATLIESIRRSLAKCPPKEQLVNVDCAVVAGEVPPTQG